MKHARHSRSFPLEEQVLSKAILRVKEGLGLKQNELSDIIGHSTSEISRLCNGTTFLSPNTKEGECALLLIKIYRNLGALLGEDPKQYQEWFKSYNHHLGDKPINLAKKITGLAEIDAYLAAMRGLA